MQWWVLIFPLLRGLEQLVTLRWKGSRSVELTLTNLWFYLDVVMSGLAIACIGFLISIIHSSSPEMEWDQYEDDARNRDWFIALLAILSILTSVRFLESFCTFGYIGETLTIVLFMIGRLVPFMVTFAVLAVGFGSAFSALVQAYFGATLVAEPRFFPWWALIGEMGFVMETMETIEADYQEHPEAQEFAISGAVERPTLVYVLFFLFGFVVNIILINLVIAQMTSAYDMVVEHSNEYRLLQRARLAIEYKDIRRAMPLAGHIIEQLRKLVLCSRISRSHGFRVPLQRYAFRRLNFAVRTARSKSENRANRIRDDDNGGGDVGAATDGADGGRSMSEKGSTPGSKIVEMLDEVMTRLDSIEAHVNPRDFGSYSGLVIPRRQVSEPSRTSAGRQTDEPGARSCPGPITSSKSMRSGAAPQETSAASPQSPTNSPPSSPKGPPLAASRI